MTDIYESQSPVVRDPTALTEDATRSSSGDDLMRILGSQTRRRGRPPGSKNKPKMDRETGQLSGGPRPRQEATTAQQAQQVRERRIRDKKRRASELEDKILKDANEAIMSILMGAGVPGEILYQQGHIPEQKVSGSHYTPIGNKIAIQRFEARVLALTLAEMEGSDIGGKISSKIAEDSPIRLAFLGIASVLVVSQHVKGVLEMRKQFEPYLKAYQEAKRAQENGDGS